MVFIIWPKPSWWNKAWINGWIIRQKTGRTAGLKGWCSADRLVTSGILQGEIPGLQWFRIFTGDLDENMESALSNSVGKLPQGSFVPGSREADYTLGSLGKSMVSRCRKVHLPLSAQWDYTWNTGCSLGLPSKRKTLPHRRESSGGHQDRSAAVHER